MKRDGSLSLTQDSFEMVDEKGYVGRFKRVTEAVIQSLKKTSSDQTTPPPSPSEAKPNQNNKD